MGGIGWLLRKLFGSLMFAITWLITVLARVLRASVGRALGWLGAQLMQVYDVAASAYARSLPDALARPTVVPASAEAAFDVALALIPTVGLDPTPPLAQEPNRE